MWFQAAECNVVNVSLLLDLINNNFLIFLKPYLPQKSENLRPHSSNSIKKYAPPLWSLQLWKCDPIQQHIPISLL